jgi:hypothetical protein
MDPQRRLEGIMVSPRPVCRKQMIWDLVKACMATPELSLKEGAKYIAVPAGV